MYTLWKNRDRKFVATLELTTGSLVHCILVVSKFSWYEMGNNTEWLADRTTIFFGCNSLEFGNTLAPDELPFPNVDPVRCGRFNSEPLHLIRDCQMGIRLSTPLSAIHWASWTVIINSRPTSYLQSKHCHPSFSLSWSTYFNLSFTFFFNYTFRLLFCWWRGEEGAQFLWLLRHLSVCKQKKHYKLSSRFKLIDKKQELFENK